MSRLLALLPCLLVLSSAFARRQADEHPLGPVPELGGVTDLAGRAVRLADVPEAAVLLFFHAGSSRYSLTGLDELVELLESAAGTRAKTRLWVLAATAEEAREAESRLAPLGEGARALIDTTRATFAAHGVIATPTVLCVSPQRSSVARVQGYGTLFAFRAELGGRLAAGLIEAPEYERLLSGQRVAPQPDASETRARVLAGKLVAAGQLDEVEPLLVQARSAHPRSAWPLALQVRCRLARGRADEARALAAELARSAPDARETRYVEGLVLEAAGETEQARDAYRAALEHCLFE